MATLLHAESRRLYSWWWDSHISPKNSKWLQENLTDMDSKVKTMIKLIEEDADSFARRAEMYYKKRPELMKLVEEFYRAYRALAERYDHATGALRQAHHTMSEAFPNQIPLGLTDESPSGSSGTGVEPHTPEMPAPIHTLYDPVELQKDALGVSSHFHVIKRNGVYSEESDALSRKGLKQLNEMFAPVEGENCTIFHDGRARKGLHFQEEEGKSSQYKTHDWHQYRPNQESSGREDVQHEIRCLQEELFQLLTKNQNLRTQKTSDTDKAETQVHCLKDSLSKLKFEKEAAVLQYQQSLERISYLETQISRTQEEFKKLNDEMLTDAMKLSGAEEHCILLEKAKQSLQLELDTPERGRKAQQEELFQLSIENQNLNSQITSESERANKAEIEVQCLKDSLSKLSFEKEVAILQYQESLERISYLETQISRTQDNLKNLSDEMVMETMKLSSAEDRCLLLEKANQSLQLELDTIELKTNTQQEELSQLSAENKYLNSQITSESKRADKAETEVQSLKDSLSKLSFEKESVILQYQQSFEKIFYLETQISRTQNDFKKLSDEMVMEAMKFCSAEDQYLVLKKENQSLQFELETLELKTKSQQEELSRLSEENKQLNNQIISETHCAEKAETEVQNLKDSLFNLSFDKEAAILQYQQALERLSYLETQISQTQDDFRKFSDEMAMEARKLGSAEERYLLLEKSNQSLQLEVDTLEQKTKSLQQELKHQEEELGKLNISIQDEHQQRMDAEMALLSMEKLHFQSQDELKLLTLEIQSGVDKLKDMEQRNKGLEEEIHHLKVDNDRISEQNISSVLKLKDLQDEINLLKKTTGKLENEMGTYLEVKEALHHELDYLKEDKNDLEQRYQSLKEEMEVVSLNAATLQALVKELQDRNVELNEIRRKYEEEKLLLLENLENMGKILDKNVVLENSLADANVELEGLREKIKTLENSSESFLGEVSTHIIEKAVFISQIENINHNMQKLRDHNMEKLREKNAFLENSLSIMNLEHENLRGKLKDIEVSCQYLHDQKEYLLAEKCVLVSQAESSRQQLENLERRHAELENKYLNLENEKDLSLLQVVELQGFLMLEKQEHESLIQLSKSQLSTLENQIHILREENQDREEEIEVEQQKVMSALMDIFILHRCLRDVKEMNLILSNDCQKHLKTSRCAEKLVCQLKQEDLIQKERISSLSEHIEMVREGILILLRALNMNKECRFMVGVKDEVLLQISLDEIRNLLNSISDAQDEIQLLQLDMSVIVTLLKQTGLHVEDLRMEKHTLQQKLEIRKEKAIALKYKNHKLSEINEQLTQEKQISGHREEDLKAAMESLHWQLTDLQVAQQASESEIHELLDENWSLLKKIFNLREEKDALEEENSDVLAEAMTLEHLYLLFRSFNDERALKLKLSCDYTDCLCAIKNNLEHKLTETNEKMSLFKLENVHLKESVACLEEYRNCLIILEFDLNMYSYFCTELTHQIETGNNILIDKEMKLSEANQKVQSMQAKNRELVRNFKGLNQDIYGSKVVREELENKIFILSGGIAYRDREIARIGEANRMLYVKLEKLNSEIEELRNRGKHFTSKLQKGFDEVDLCEVESMKLLNELQISTVSSAIFEEKVFELIFVCESLEIYAMVQSEALNEHISSRNAYVSKLKKKLDDLEGENQGLKANLSAYLSLVISLRDNIASLEEQTLSLAANNASNKQEKQDNSVICHQHDKGNPQTEDSIAMVPAGVLELQKITKIKAVQSVITDTSSLLKHERFDSRTNLELAMNEIEGIEVKGSSRQEEVKESKVIIMQVNEGGEEPSSDHRLQKDDAMISKMKFGQMMKDIQLDQVSSSPYGNSGGLYNLTRIENSETDDQMLELWEAAERDCNKEMQQVPPVGLVHDIEAVEEEKSEYPSSELVAEKELSINRLDIPSEVGDSPQQQSRKVIQRLASDAKRLSVLQMNVQELKKKIEGSEKRKRAKSLEYDTVKTKLKEAERDILELIDINSKLTKEAEDCHASSDSMSGAQEETGNMSRRQISERLEKIGKLELELQKIQYIFLKLGEEHDNGRTKTTVRGPKVLLRDLIYGRRNGSRQKNGSFCGCMRPKTNGD